MEVVYLVKPLPCKGDATSSSPRTQIENLVLVAHAYGGGDEGILEVHWLAILAGWSAPVSVRDSASGWRTIEDGAQRGHLACTGACVATLHLCA